LRLDGRGLILGREKKFSVFHKVQIGFGAHPASYTNDSEGYFPGGYNGRGVKLTTHFYLVSRSVMVELYLRSPV
jgi:hypothetical protein